MHIVESLQADILKPPHPNIRSVYVMLVRWPGKELPEALGWASLDNGVVAYRCGEYEGNATNSCRSLLLHLTSGADLIEALSHHMLTWVPMPCAPLTFNPIEQEFESANTIAKRSFDISGYFSRAAITETWQLWHEFIDSLDCSIWNRLNELSTDLPTCENYNLFLHEDRRLSRWRQQAFFDNAFLTRSVTRPLRAAWRSFAVRDSMSSDILSFIDSGKPLFQSISHRLNIPSVVLRHCKNLVLDFLPDMEAGEALRQIHASLPVECYPDTNDEAYLRCLWHWLKHLGLPAGRLLMPLSTRNRTRISVELGIFKDEVNRYFGRSPIALDPDIAPQSFDSALDFLNALLAHEPEEVTIDGFFSSLPYPALIDLVIQWLQKRGVGSFIRAANAWHDVVIADPAPYHDEVARGPERWQPILDGPFLIQDHLFVELSNREALLEEGLSMQHCVSTYPCRCAKGTRVFSIRNLENQRLATLALTSRLIGNSKADEDIRYIVEQVRGPTNSDPTPQAWSAAVRLCETVNICKFHSTRQAILQECRRFSEIEWSNESSMVRLALQKGGKNGKPDFLPLWQALSEVPIT